MGQVWPRLLYIPPKIHLKSWRAKKYTLTGSTHIYLCHSFIIQPETWEMLVSRCHIGKEPNVHSALPLYWDFQGGGAKMLAWKSLFTAQYSNWCESTQVRKSTVRKIFSHSWNPLQCTADETISGRCGQSGRCALMMLNHSGPRWPRHSGPLNRGFGISLYIHTLLFWKSCSPTIIPFLQQHRV